MEEKKKVVQAQEDERNRLASELTQKAQELQDELKAFSFSWKDAAFIRKTTFSFRNHSLTNEKMTMNVN